jgi:hypothetical protein
MQFAPVGDRGVLIPLEEPMTPNQKKIALAVGGGIAVLCIIASCSRRTPDYAYAPQQQVVAAAPAYAPAPVAAAPVIVNQAPAHDGFLTGLLAGHMLSGMGGGGSRVEHHYVNSPAPATTNVTKNVTINKTYVQPTPAVVAKPAPAFQSRPLGVAAAPKPTATTSGYGGYGKTTSIATSSRGYSSYGRGR